MKNWLTKTMVLVFAGILAYAPRNMCAEDAVKSGAEVVENKLDATTKRRLEIGKKLRKLELAVGRIAGKNFEDIKLESKKYQALAYPNAEKPLCTFFYENSIGKGDILFEMDFPNKPGIVLRYVNDSVSRTKGGKLKPGLDSIKDNMILNIGGNDREVDSNSSRDLIDFAERLYSASLDGLLMHVRSSKATSRVPERLMKDD